MPFTHCQGTHLVKRGVVKENEMDLKQFFTKEANETFVKWKKEVLKNSIHVESVTPPRGTVTNLKE